MVIIKLTLSLSLMLILEHYIRNVPLCADFGSFFFENSKKPPIINDYGVGIALYFKFLVSNISFFYVNFKL